MAWERRQRGGLYYTRSLRADGRVVREYVGRGPAAEEAAFQDAAGQTERQSRREELRAEKKAVQELRGSLLTLTRQLDGLTSHVLEAVGFHRHRGEWRKQRT